MVERAIFDYIRPYCGLDLEDNKPFCFNKSLFSLDNLGHDDASPYQVWLQKGQPLIGYHADDYQKIFLTFAVTVNKAIRFFSQDTLAYDKICRLARQNAPPPPPR